jgi:hypothetical protein
MPKLANSFDEDDLRNFFIKEKTRRNQRKNEEKKKWMKEMRNTSFMVY